MRNSSFTARGRAPGVGCRLYGYLGLEDPNLRSRIFLFHLSFSFSFFIFLHFASGFRTTQSHDSPRPAAGHAAWRTAATIPDHVDRRIVEAAWA